MTTTTAPDTDGLPAPAPGVVDQASGPAAVTAPPPVSGVDVLLAEVERLVAELLDMPDASWHPVLMASADSSRLWSGSVVASKH